MRSGLRGSTGVHPPTSTRPIRGTGTRTHSGDRWPGRYRDPRCRACSASTPFASAMLNKDGSSEIGIGDVVHTGAAAKPSPSRKLRRSR